ncbi:hypothetical protein MKW94_012204 [Papaver nudicaule]|uniref:Uncharacterized protein n=1 Tax=Papaver nudicaule TaxID=74823 RepID=A0AA41VJF8_PAPNU|nr:hypothetical protein [Papaver nudicaule]
MDNARENRVLNGLFILTSGQLIFSSQVALRLLSMHAEVGRQDPLLRYSLAVLYCVFTASLFSNLFGILVFVLLSPPKYLTHRNFILIISNGVSLVFMVFGFVLFIVFDVQLV